MRAPIILALCLWIPARALAQERPREVSGPYDRGAVSVEFAAGGLVEAWNTNRDREWLLDITGSVWWAVRDEVAVGAEFRHARVYQETPNAFLQGLSTLFRWRFLDRPTWALFVEVGPGISWSDIDTPPNGTKFNYLFQGSTGFLRRLGRNVHALGAFRFLHISNNGREGTGRNPDIEALGGFGGVAVTF
jgi:hypothetical protein